MSSQSRTAIVTGAAGDIAQVIALRLAQDGYKVTITDLESRRGDLDKVAKTITDAGREVFVITGDVTKEQDVQTIVQENVKHFGSLEIMVSTVGKFIGHSITDFPVEEWDEIMNTNAKGTMLCYKTAANQMLKQKKEKDNGAHYRIIGISSVAGLTGAPLCSAYAASKFAVRGLTQAAASDLGPHGITVNSIGVGFIGGTKMLRNLEETVTKAYGLPDGAWHSAAIDGNKLRRFGEPRHVAHLVSHLASEDAEFTTGQMIICDGGMHLV